MGADDRLAPSVPEAGDGSNERIVVGLLDADM